MFVYLAKRVLTWAFFLLFHINLRDISKKFHWGSCENRGQWESIHVIHVLKRTIMVKSIKQTAVAVALVPARKWMNTVSWTSFDTFLLTPFFCHCCLHWFYASRAASLPVGALNVSCPQPEGYYEGSPQSLPGGFLDPPRPPKKNFRPQGRRSVAGKSFYSMT